jgi:hypothetical protein
MNRHVVICQAQRFIQSLILQSVGPDYVDHQLQSQSLGRKQKNQRMKQKRSQK